MSKLNNKVAVVTGGSKGIGAGIALALAGAGAAVVVNYASSKAGAEAVAAQIVKQGGRAIVAQGDMSKPADVKRVFADAKRVFGGVDVLVNNAGIYRFGPLDAVTEDDYRAQFDINVLGTLLASQEAARHFGAGGGSIVNVGSIASVARMPNSAVYSATKGAVDAITRVLAFELAGRQIRVNTIAPGATATEGLQTMGVTEGSDMHNAMLAAIPAGRLGRPDDIAGLAVFLASDESRWITGERITASGGQY
jgi:3-oxoacyl-[acyl-carrier protein] reductase